MSKYLILHQVNAAIQPADPKVALEETEANLAAVDELQKAGIFKEIGTFNPGEGYIIAEFPSLAEAFKLAQFFWPGVTTDIREIISFEKTKEIVLSSLREQAK
jgi:uncharacterized protein YciI